MNIFKKCLAKRKANSSRECLAKRKANIIIVEVTESGKFLNEESYVLNVSALRNEVLEALTPTSKFMIEARMIKSNKSQLYTRMRYDIAKENSNGVTYTSEEETKILAIYIYCLTYNNKEDTSYHIRVKYNYMNKSNNSIAKVFIPLLEHKD